MVEHTSIAVVIAIVANTRVMEHLTAAATPPPHSVTCTGSIGMPSAAAVRAEALAHASKSCRPPRPAHALSVGKYVTACAPSSIRRLFAPNLKSNDEAIGGRARTITRLATRPGEHVSIALDPASVSFMTGERQIRFQEIRQVRRTSEQMTKSLAGWCGSFHFSIEDGLARGRLGRMKHLTAELAARLNWWR